MAKGTRGGRRSNDGASGHWNNDSYAKEKGYSAKTISFNNSRFGELGWEALDKTSNENRYNIQKRVSDDENKIVVKVGEAHVKETMYGYSLTLDNQHVVYLKDWQVSKAKSVYDDFGGDNVVNLGKAYEVLLTKKYFNVKQTKYENLNFGEQPEALKWDYWVKTAKGLDQKTAYWSEYNYKAKMFKTRSKLMGY